MAQFSRFTKLREWYVRSLKIIVPVSIVATNINAPFKPPFETQTCTERIIHRGLEFYLNTCAGGVWYYLSYYFTFSSVALCRTLLSKQVYCL